MQVSQLVPCVRRSSPVTTLEGPLLDVVLFVEISCVLGGPKLLAVWQM